MRYWSPTAAPKISSVQDGSSSKQRSARRSGCGWWIAQTAGGRPVRKNQGDGNPPVLHNGQVLYLEKLTGDGGTVLPTRVGAGTPEHVPLSARCCLTTPMPWGRCWPGTLPVSARGSITVPACVIANWILSGGRPRVRARGVPSGSSLQGANLSRRGCGRAVSVTRVGGQGLELTDAAAARRMASEIGCWLVIARTGLVQRRGTATRGVGGWSEPLAIGREQGENRMEPRDPSSSSGAPFRGFVASNPCAEGDFEEKSSSSNGRFQSYDKPSLTQRRHE